MIDEFFQEQAALYAAGALSTGDRDQLEVILAFNDELREFTAGLTETSVAVTLMGLRSGKNKPPPELKARILSRISDLPQQVIEESLVVSGPDGVVQWVNQAFSEMCGYTLEELRGKKLGPILQGEKTDRETAGRLREAVHACRPCREAIINYRKNGEPYWVEVAINPFLNGIGQPLYLLARERELAGAIP
jgi:PAS domain S-box-containing protein